MYQPQKILKQYWGYEKFRHLQQEIVESVLSGQDALALLPTGGGKSLCYQLPALCKEGLCLVISPLIALMKDQVDQLSNLGIKAYAIYTGLTNREIDIILDNCVYGNVKLLYVSPERLQTELFIERVKKMNINLLAVDESHCISQWGYDFRPTYLKIAEFRQATIPDVNTIALTATATEKVVEDICEKLELKNQQIFKASFVRENIAFAVRKVESKEQKLIEILNNVPGTALVYARSRKRTKELCDILLRNQISADYYHAGLNHDQRMKKQELWQAGRIRVIVGTNAFGMGINKENVRVVIHFDVPDNLEAYYQEAGRAGRDGKKAYAVIIYHEGDKQLLNAFFENAHPSHEFMKHIYQALANYYKIAVGSNMLSFFDFDITDFCTNFNLNNSETYYAIRKLEEEGFIELNESFYHPSKISINLAKSELYKFQIANESFDPLIKTLLRFYGGELLGNFVRISENQIARILNTSTFKVKSQLDYLNNLKVITYDRMRDKPQIAFITPRFDASKLPLNKQRLTDRRGVQKKKMEAMINYVEHSNQCRTGMILEYFNERNFQDCGHCDYCLDKKRSLSKSDHKRIRELVHYELNKGPKLPEDLTNLFAHHELPLMEEIIREMTDSDDLTYDSMGRLVWIKK
ncbi:MAG: RecQ family ATP-dependent DNA helicase [Cyclobacteriaceae bacterium]|nr:RecQ family ATP-dependent DNA helicase [Cyclobacteriaceae bacterium]